MSMYQFSDLASLYGIWRAAKQYPLDRNYGGIYSPGVTVFRGEERAGYPLLDEYYQVDIISVAGMNRPPMNEDGEIIPPLVPGIKNKIRTILRIGILQNNDALVLGALGCGAFGNPPAQIAHLFHEVLDEMEFQNRFSIIRFAILEDHNSMRTGQEEGNFLPFLREFS